MLKRFVFLMLFCFIGMPTFSYTIKGAVSYTIETARNIAFEGIEKKIDINNHKNYLMDENFECNIKALSKGKYRFQNRKITKFSDGGYSVLYSNDPTFVYYYNKTGKLEAVDYDEKCDFPCRTIKYNNNGILDSVIVSVSPKEQYMFDADGNYGGHWIGKNC